MIKEILSKLFTEPRFEAVKVTDNVYMIDKVWKSFGITRREVLGCYYASWYVHQRVKFLNNLYSGKL